jgi:hypothetical protein
MTEKSKSSGTKASEKKAPPVARGVIHPPLLPVPEAAPVQPSLTSISPLRWLASLLVLGAVAMLLVSAFLPSNIPSSVPAVGLLLLVFGLICAFPSVLTDGGNQVSAMRAVVLLIVSTFALLTVKNSWSNASIIIDPSWKYILAAALGGKAVQSFSENFSPPPGGLPKIGSPNYTPPSPSSGSR